MEKMLDLFTGSFMPHGHCYLWKPAILWMHVISDVVIVLSYYSIPVILIYVVVKSKESLPFNRTFLLFAIFILACGTTHLLSLINVWQTKYALAGFVKVLTAIASLATVVSLIPILPKVIDTLRESEKK